MKQPVSQIRLDVYMIVATIFLHGGMMVLNELFGRQAEYLQGIGWIYIPAGTRLLCTLLFGRAGMLGLLITGWIATYWYYFPGDAVRATIGTIAGAVGPYLVYLIAQRRFGLQSSLANLTPGRLLVCALACSVASPLLHHLWFSLHGEANLLPGFLVMCAGDLAGTLIVLYTFKGLLYIAGRGARARQ
jgi:hypothetical protein